MKPPKNLDNLADILHQLRLDRRRRKAELNPPKGTRKTLTPAERKLILAKTNKRCHICGGKINGKWQADHVLAHSGGGEHAIEQQSRFKAFKPEAVSSVVEASHSSLKREVGWRPLKTRSR